MPHRKNENQDPLHHFHLIFIFQSDYLTLEIFVKIHLNSKAASQALDSFCNLFQNIDQKGWLAQLFTANFTKNKKALGRRDALKIIISIFRQAQESVCVQRLIIDIKLSSKGRNCTHNTTRDCEWRLPHPSIKNQMSKASTLLHFQPTSHAYSLSSTQLHNSITILKSWQGFWKTASH